jgi:hypothetical protein
MIQRESHFEYLIALAVAGQISDTELEELLDHTATCTSCSQLMSEMESTNFQLFLTLAAQIKKPRISSRMRERFLIRATRSGVVMPAPSSGIQRSHLVHFAALLIAVCLFVGMGWRHITGRSSERTTGSAPVMRLEAARQISSAARRDFAAPEVSVAEVATNGRRNRRSPGRSASLPSPAPGDGPRIAVRPLFRLNTSLFPSGPDGLNAVAKPSGLQHLTAEYFSPRGLGLEPNFSTPAVWNSTASDVLSQHVFRYRATLASVSLQDDQAVFGLKPRVRDLTFSNTLDSAHSR